MMGKLVHLLAGGACGGQARPAAAKASSWASCSAPSLACPQPAFMVLNPTDIACSCEPLVPPEWAAHRAWVALIARSQDKEGCTFDVKVRWRSACCARADWH